MKINTQIDTYFHRTQSGAKQSQCNQLVSILLLKADQELVPFMYILYMDSITTRTCSMGRSPGGASQNGGGAYLHLNSVLASPERKSQKKGTSIDLLGFTDADETLVHSSIR